MTVATTDQREWLRARLDNWARWVTEGSAVALGYPRVNVLQVNRGRSASVDHVPVVSLAAQQIDGLVRHLRTQDAGLWLAVWLRYVGDPSARPSERRPMTTREMAGRLGVGDRAVLARLARAEDTMASMLPAMPWREF